MKNTLNDLNMILFETLERIVDAEPESEELQVEINRSQAVARVAETIIKNGELALKAAKHSDEYGYDRKPIQLIGEIESCKGTPSKLKSL